MKNYKTLMIVLTLMVVIATIILYMNDERVWIIGAVTSIFYVIDLILVHIHDKDFITKCVRKRDINGLFEYAYYVAGKELDIKADLEKGRITKIHALILLRFCSYRIGKTLRAAQRTFNLDFADLRKRIDEFADKKFAEKKEYEQEIEKMRRDDNGM